MDIVMDHREEIPDKVAIWAREERVQKYISQLSSYGVYPILDLLRDYETEEDYMECSIILEAVNRRYKDIKSEFPGIRHKAHPTHIDHFDDRMYRNMFDAFGLTGETAKKNTAFYKKAIKKYLG